MRELQEVEKNVCRVVKLETQEKIACTKKNSIQENKQEVGGQVGEICCTSTCHLCGQMEVLTGLEISLLV